MLLQSYSQNPVENTSLTIGCNKKNLVPRGKWSKATGSNSVASEPVDNLRKCTSSANFYFLVLHIIIISTIVSMGTLHPVRLSYVVSASRFTPPLLLSPTSDSPVHVLFHMMTMIGPQRYPYDKGRVQKPQSRKNSVLFTFSVMSASVTVIFGRKIAFLVKSFLSYVRYKGRGTSLMECLLFHFGNDATSHQSSSWMLICVFKTVDVWSISAFSLSQPRVPLKNQLKPPLRLITAQSPPMNGELVAWRDNKYDSLPILLTFPL